MALLYQGKQVSFTFQWGAEYLQKCARKKIRLNEIIILPETIMMTEPIGKLTKK